MSIAHLCGSRRAAIDEDVYNALVRALPPEERRRENAMGTLSARACGTPRVATSDAGRTAAYFRAERRTP